MRMRTLVLVALVALGALFAVSWTRTVAAEEDKGPVLVHNVFFSLTDNSEESKKVFLASCKKYLTKHPGEVYFAVGPLVADLKREVNDRDFDVALTIAFKNKAAHDQYQDAKRHLEFIAENKAKFKKVRVFDSYAE